MDPRVAWYQNELISNAYSTWANVWMVSQMNCTNSNSALGSTSNINSSSSSNVNNLNNVNSNQRNNLELNVLLDKSVPIVAPTTVTADSTNKLASQKELSSSNENLDQAPRLSLSETNLGYNLNLNVTSQTILNGLKSRKFNKASTFGFNFPIYQHILEDPLSTPWLLDDSLEINNNFNKNVYIYKNNFLNASSLLFLNRNNNFSFDCQQQKSEKSDDISTYSSYLIDMTKRNKNKAFSRSSSSSSTSSTSSISTSPNSSSLSRPSSPQNNTIGTTSINTNVNYKRNEEDSLTNSSTSSANFDSHEENTESHFDLSDDKLGYSEGLSLLHKEIMLFSDYIAPTLEELYMRNEIIWRITKVIKEKLPNAEVDIFGSYKTGLFLPTSDIDMVVFGDWKHLPLTILKDALIDENISDQENIKVLDKATVPIIKILETKTDIKIDISFNTLNGVKSAELIKKFLAEFPCLRPLVMVLKQFLIQRDYNEVWTGGIGSYSLILMTVSFLQLHSRSDPRSMKVNLGVLLIEFFELYGRCFNYMKTAIRIQNGGCYLPKEEILKNFSNGHRSSVLCIEDPLNPANDIGKGSYGALKVKQAFEYAYFNLSHAVLPQNEFILKSKCKSMLGRIIRITKEVREYRKWVKETFEDKVNMVFNLAKEIVDMQKTNYEANEPDETYQGNNLNLRKSTEKNVEEEVKETSNLFQDQIVKLSDSLDDQSNKENKRTHFENLSEKSQANNLNEIENFLKSQVVGQMQHTNQQNYHNNQLNNIHHHYNHHHHHYDSNQFNHQQKQEKYGGQNIRYNQHQSQNRVYQSQHSNSNQYSNINQTLNYLNQQYQQNFENKNSNNGNSINQNRKKSNGSIRSFDSNDSSNNYNSSTKIKQKIQSLNNNQDQSNGIANGYQNVNNKKFKYSENSQKQAYSSKGGFNHNNSNNKMNSNNKTNTNHQNGSKTNFKYYQNQQNNQPINSKPVVFYIDEELNSAYNNETNSDSCKYLNTEICTSNLTPPLDQLSPVSQTKETSLDKSPIKEAQCEDVSKNFKKTPSKNNLFQSNQTTDLHQIEKDLVDSPNISIKSPGEELIEKLFKKTNLDVKQINKQNEIFNSNNLTSQNLETYCNQCRLLYLECNCHQEHIKKQANRNHLLLVEKNNSDRLEFEENDQQNNPYQKKKLVSSKNQESSDIEENLINKNKSCDDFFKENANKELCQLLSEIKNSNLANSSSMTNLIDSGLPNSTLSNRNLSQPFIGLDKEKSLTNHTDSNLSLSNLFVSVANSARNHHSELDEITTQSSRLNIVNTSQCRYNTNTKSSAKDTIYNYLQSIGNSKKEKI